MGTTVVKGEGYEIKAAEKDEWQIRSLTPDGRLNFVQRIQFQNGPLENGLFNGITNEQLLEVLIARTNVLNERMHSDHNDRALVAMQTALDEFNTRTNDRKARGVEGTLNV